MVEFAQNNAKNLNIGHTPFESNCGYHPCVSYKENLDSRFKPKSIDKLSTELQKLITVYKENFHYMQKLQKRANDKAMKPKSYTSNNKV